MSGDILVVRAGVGGGLATGIWWVGAMDVAQYPSSYSTQDSPSQQRIICPQMSVVLRLSSFALISVSEFSQLKRAN